MKQFLTALLALLTVPALADVSWNTYPTNAQPAAGDTYLTGTSSTNNRVTVAAQLHQTSTNVTVNSNNYSGTFTGTGDYYGTAHNVSTAISNWVLQLTASGLRHYYFSNVTNGFTTASITNNVLGITNYTMIDAPLAAIATNGVLVNGLANAYFLSRISTNYVTRVETGPVDLETYIFLTGAGPPTVTAHPELYLWFTNDTIIEITSAPDQIFAGTNPQRFNISMFVNSSTNVDAGTRLVLRWKITSETGVPTFNFVIGGNYDSHISLDAHQ